MTGLVASLALFAVVTVCSLGAANLLAASSGAQFGLRRSAGLLTGITVAVIPRSSRRPCRSRAGPISPGPVVLALVIATVFAGVVIPMWLH